MDQTAYGVQKKRSLEGVVEKDSGGKKTKKHVLTDVSNQILLAEAAKQPCQPQ